MDFDAVTFDILVVGAGPVGLLMAEQLAKKFKVLVILFEQF